MEGRIRLVADRIGSIEGLDAVAKPLKKAFDNVVKAGPVKDTLAGTWMGHPLHPALTDVPIGAWSSSFILDWIGGKKARPAADALLGVGIVTAIPTAVSGLTDWTDTWGKTQRIGVVHAVGNVAAVGLFTLSLRARRRGKRFRGKVLSALGMGASTGAAWLGGHLSFGKGVGVDTTIFDREPEKWTSVLAADALSEGKPVKAETSGADILVYKRGDELFAISDTCSHRACSLSDGDVEDGAVECPCHGSAFRLSDGGVVRGPATAPQPAYDARITDGRVEVKLREPKN
jgi:nitrite reductase/ring-hydroxylating ferredoxin subunit